MIRIGAHVGAADPLGEAEERGADLIQMFISNPQSYKKPVPRPDTESLIASGLPIYVHAPYIMNPASPNNRIRIPSRKTLAQTVAAAAELGAEGVIVHGGHVGDDEDVAVGFERWRKALDSFDAEVPLLIENTAGGGNAVVRELDNYGPLWDEIGGYNVGVCLDTCHAWASGEDLETAVDRIVAATGKVDLVHCNDSRDPFNSRRDRHTNLGHGEIPEQLIVSVVRAAGAPVIVETPSDNDGQKLDIAWLRARL